MPYDIRKRNCKQADGKKGKYVVVKKKSKGRTEQESCHTSKKKAKGAVRARYASEANEGETVKITLEELRQLIGEAMATLGERDEVEEYGFGASDDPMRELSDEARGEIEEAIETTVDPDVVKNYLDSEGGAAGPEDTVAAVRNASDADDDQALTDDEILAKVKDIEGVEQSSAGDLVDTTTLTEAVMVALQPMIKPVHQEMTQDDFWMKVAGIKAESVNEGEVIDFPGMRREPELPFEFGPQGYIARPELKQKMSDLEYGPDSAPEDILAIALSNRAEELIGYVQTVDPKHFEDLAMDVYAMIVEDEETLEDLTSRIDAGDYFDEEILDALDRVQMSATRDRAARQDPDDIGDMELAFAKFLDGKEEEMEAVRNSDNVIPLEPKED